MRIDVGTEQLILFEDMSEPNNIAIRGSAGSGKTHQILEIAKQVNPCKVIIVSDHVEDYSCILPNIEIHSILDFIIDYENAIIVFDCPRLLSTVYNYVDKLSKISRFKNSVLITIWNDLDAENSIVMNCKYIVNTTTERLNTGVRIYGVSVS